MGCPLLECLFPLLLKVAWTLDVVLETESNLARILRILRPLTRPLNVLFFGFLWGKTCDFTEWNRGTP